MVDFCNNCGALIFGSSGSKVACSSCGKNNKVVDNSVSFKKKIEPKENNFLGKVDSSIIHPITNDVICPKCKKKNSRYWTKQMRSSDEPETHFF